MTVLSGLVQTVFSLIILILIIYHLSKEHSFNETAHSRLLRELREYHEMVWQRLANAEAHEREWRMRYDAADRRATRLESQVQALLEERNK